MTDHPLLIIAQIRAIASPEVRAMLPRLEIAVVSMRRGKVDPTRIRVLRTQGLSDTQIAERLGVSDSAVLYWRRRLHLPAITRHQWRIK